MSVKLEDGSAPQTRKRPFLVDTRTSSRALWLVKVPHFVASQWQVRPGDGLAASRPN